MRRGMVDGQVWYSSKVPPASCELSSSVTVMISLYCYSPFFLGALTLSQAAPVGRPSLPGENRTPLHSPPPYLFSMVFNGFPIGL